MLATNRQRTEAPLDSIRVQPPRPNLFIVGAPRCGTTSMHHYLGTHPEVFMSEPKEPHRFGSDLDLSGPRYDQMRNDLDAYLGIFAAGAGSTWVGEASPGYLCSEVAASEIREFSPEARILVMLRPPSEVIASLHHLFVNDGNEDLPLAEALAAEPARMNGDRLPPRMHSRHGLYYRRNVRFPEQLRRFMDAFGPERVKVVLLEDLRRDSESTFSDVCRFLGVDDTFKPPLEPVNSARTPRNRALAGVLQEPPSALRALGRVTRPVAEPLVRWVRDRNTSTARPDYDLELLRRLDEEFAPMVEELGELIDRDLNHWKHAHRDR